MIGYIFGIGIVVILLAVTISSNYALILTERQVKELWISTFLMIILLGYVRSRMLDLEPMSNYVFIPAGLYVLWYFLTKFTANLINKDDNIIRTTTF